MHKITIGLKLLTNDFLKLYKNSERINYILENIRNGKIVVLEGELTPEEYNKMIQNTLKMINNTFFGFEMEKVEVKKGVLRKVNYTIIKPRIPGVELALKSEAHGIDIIAEAKLN